MLIICHGLKDEDFQVEFTDHRISLGRDASNSIVVMADAVSRCHAFLIEEGNDLFLQDNSSLNGTFLNYNQIHDKQKLASGDILQIGSCQIKVDFFPDQTVLLNFFPPEQTNQFNGETIVSPQFASGAQSPRDVGILFHPWATVQNPSDGEGIEHTMVISNDAPEAGQSPSPFERTLLSADGIGHTMLAPKTMRSSTAVVYGAFSPGSEIGKYQIIKRLGKGGMGEVFLGIHETRGTRCAIKVLSKDAADDDTQNLKRFLREAKIASKIRHQNVVNVMDVETDPATGLPYIVMEYIDGGSLRDALKGGKRLSEKQAVVIVEAVACALKAAEKHKIVHRDIKPDNIMFTKQGEVKLADLGIAKVIGKDTTGLTQSNMMIGTPAYLPPEQAQNAKGVDCRADIYSLGASFYEMVTGYYPYPGETPVEILHKLFSDPVPDPRKLNSNISSTSASIIMKMLAKDPKDRFQNVDELLEVMYRNYPAYSDSQKAELVKEVIAGKCQDRSALRIGIIWPRLMALLGYKPRAEKIVRLAVILFLLFFIFYRIVVLFKDGSETFSSIYDRLALWHKNAADFLGYDIVLKPTRESPSRLKPPAPDLPPPLSSEQPESEDMDRAYAQMIINEVLHKDQKNRTTSSSDSGGAASATAEQKSGTAASPTAEQKSEAVEQKSGTAASATAEQKSGVSPVDHKQLLVTTNADVVDPSDGVVSLREALDYAQRYAPGSNRALTVTFAKDSRITLSSPLTVWGGVIVDGGKNKITLTGPKTAPIFRVTDPNVSLTLKNLVLSSDCSGDDPGIMDASSGRKRFRFRDIVDDGAIPGNASGMIRLVSVKDGGKARRFWSISGFCVILDGATHLHRLSGSDGAVIRIEQRSVLENSTIAGREGMFIVYGTLKNSSASDYGRIHIFNKGIGENLTVRNTGFVENRPGGTIRGLNLGFGAVCGYIQSATANRPLIRGQISVGGIVKTPSRVKNALRTVGRETDIVFDLTERTGENSFSFYCEAEPYIYSVEETDPSQPLIDDMDLFSGADNYSIRVREDQEPGTYMLAGNATGFKLPVSIEVGNMVYFKSLSIGRSYTLKNKVFSLSVTKQGKNSSSGGGILVLTIKQR